MCFAGFSIALKKPLGPGLYHCAIMILTLADRVENCALISYLKANSVSATSEKCDYGGFKYGQWIGLYLSLRRGLSLFLRRRL